jgi:tRNA(Ile)-lysidine synthase
MGVDHRVLNWEGPKPVSGVASAARRARHRLIAEAARAAGACVIQMGHTADDIMEATLMSREGGQVSAPRVWSPSPVWPDGRDLFIVRPLLGARRSAIRAWLSALGETWIDDPANDDIRQPRALARSRLTSLATPLLSNSRTTDLTALLGATQVGPAGEFRLERAVLTEARGADLFLAAAIASVSGTERPPRGSAVRRLRARLNRPDDLVATLAGARIAARGSILTIVRETGDQRTRPAPRLEIEPGQTDIYDGRFEVSARAGDLVLRPLSGLANHLESTIRRRVALVAPTARPSLPALVDGAGRVTCPTLTPDPRVQLRCLASARLAGACGAVSREREIGKSWFPGAESPGDGAVRGEQADGHGGAENEDHQQH